MSEYIQLNGLRVNYSQYLKYLEAKEKAGVEYLDIVRKLQLKFTRTKKTRYIKGIVVENNSKIMKEVKPC
jgi:hypothetical protein